MLKNGFLQNTKNLNIIQKAIMATVGVTTSKELIKKAAIGLYDDISKVVGNLLSDLEERGEITTKNAREIIKEIQKKSESEKTKMERKIQKDSTLLLKKAKDIILTPLVIGNQLAKTLSNGGKAKKPTKSKKRKK